MDQDLDDGQGRASARTAARNPFVDGVSVRPWRREDPGHDLAEAGGREAHDTVSGAVVDAEPVRLLVPDPAAREDDAADVADDLVRSLRSEDPFLDPATDDPRVLEVEQGEPGPRSEEHTSELQSQF